MHRVKTTLFLLFITASTSFGQETKAWTEADRKFLLDNLTRSRDELIRETKDLSKAQWSFKESPDRWSINEIVEHIAIWELLLCDRISNQLEYDAHPELIAQAVPDSVKLGFIMEEKPHHSADYTKPYTYTIPMGINELKSNIAWLLKMRNESINYVSSAQDDLRAHFLPGSKTNTHGTFITLFGHTDRHLRQIRKVKQHPAYPKK
ncbi:DinB family protein [Chryseolinea sp. T2]|uniref:DinB family protein n=1 Tax=Chryseolinea sp. T2 TaxID=3129255 RepID=UPI003077DB64